MFDNGLKMEKHLSQVKFEKLSMNELEGIFLRTRTDKRINRFFKPIYAES